MSRRAKAVLWTFGGLVGLAAAAAISFLVVVQTDWFKNQVRERIVSVAEQATGGRVEIGRFNYDWHALSAEVAPFVLHGSEPPSSPPFFRAAKIRVGLRIISAFKKQVDIASLQVDQPQLYVIVAPDGSTNVPRPYAGSLRPERHPAAARFESAALPTSRRFLRLQFPAHSAGCPGRPLAGLLGHMTRMAHAIAAMSRRGKCAFPFPN